MSPQTAILGADVTLQCMYPRMSVPQYSLKFLMLFRPIGGDCVRTAYPASLESIPQQFQPYITTPVGMPSQQFL